MGARGLFAYFFTVVVLAGYADATDLRAWSALPDVCEEFVNLKLLKGDDNRVATSNCCTFAQNLTDDVGEGIPQNRLHSSSGLDLFLIDSVESSHGMPTVDQGTFCEQAAGTTMVAKLVQPYCNSSGFEYVVPREEDCPLDCDAERVLFQQSCNASAMASDPQALAGCCGSTQLGESGRGGEWPFVVSRCYCARPLQDIAHVVEVEALCLARNLSMGLGAASYESALASCATDTTQVFALDLANGEVDTAESLWLRDGCAVFSAERSDTELAKYNLHVYPADGSQVMRVDSVAWEGMYITVNLTSNESLTFWPWANYPCRVDAGGCVMNYRPIAGPEHLPTCSGHGRCQFSPPFYTSDARCVCEEGYVGDQCEIQWSAGGFDVFDGVPEYFVDAAATTGAMVGTEADPFPSLRQALDNTPKSSARVFKFKPGTYSGPANILGARETLAMEAPLALVSAEGAERTAFDCGGDDGHGLLRLLDSYVSMFWMQGFAVRNCHEAVQVGISRSGKSGAPVLVKRALATFSHMLFEGNHGDCGTTIHVVDALVRVADSVFRNNENNFEGDDTFFARGGVMCVEAGSLSLERVEMYNNTAGRGSAALHVESSVETNAGAVLMLEDVRVFNNTIRENFSSREAADLNGAIVSRSHGDDMPMHITFNRVQVFNNTNCRGVVMYGGHEATMRAVKISGHSFSNGTGLLLRDLVPFSSVLYTAGGLHVTMEDCSISSNEATMGSGGGIGIDIQSYKSMVTMTRVEVYDNMAALSGGGVVAQFGAPGSQVLLASSELTRNTARVGGGLSGTGTGTVTLLNVSVTGNTGLVAGGGISAALNLQLVLQDSRVTDNALQDTLLDEAFTSVKGNGGGVLLQMLSTMHMSRTLLAHNRAFRSGGCVHMAESELLVSDGAVFEKCTATTSGGGLSMQSGWASFSGAVNFTSNTASKGNGGALRCDNSLVNFDKEAVVHIDRNSAQAMGGALSLESNCHMTAHNTSHVHLSSNTALLQGGAAMLHQFSTLELHSGTCTEDGEGGAECLDHSAGTVIEDNTSQEDGGGVFLTERATLHVFGRALIRSNTAVGNGGAVATAGGVVNFAGAHIFQVRVLDAGDWEQGNSAGGSGGATAFARAATEDADLGVILRGTTWQNNTAGQDGGGMWVGLLRAHESTRNGTGNLSMEACTFRGNSALGGGGGIFSAVNISERTLTFIENTARYGNNSATPPETLVFTGGCAGQEDDSAGGASDAVVCRIHASSGETMRPITVHVLDAHGAVVQSFSNTAILHLLGPELDASFSTRARTASHVSLTGAERNFHDGVIEFEDLVVRAPPGITYTLKMVISSLAPEVEARLEPLALEVMLRACDAYTEYLYDDVCMKVTLECSPGHYLVRNNKTNECIPCPRGTFKEGVNNRDVCDRCPAQSEFQSTGATSLSQCRCVAGTYVVWRANQTSKEMTCEDCPLGALCAGGNEVTAAKGYWRRSPDDFIFYKCKVGRCTGEVFPYDGHACRDGHEGRLCAECETGRSMHASLCEECSDKVVFGGYVLLSVVALMCMAPVFLFTCFPLFKYMHHKRASDRKNDKMMTREDVEDDIIRSNSMVLRSLQSIHIERASRSPSENTPTPRSASLHIESPSSKATHRKTRAIDDFFAENALHAAGDMQLANTTLGGGNDMAALGLAQRQLSTTQVLENIANSEGIRNVLVRWGVWDSDFVQYMMIAMEVTIKELIEKGFTMITLAADLLVGVISYLQIVQTFQMYDIEWPKFMQVLVFSLSEVLVLSLPTMPTVSCLFRGLGFYDYFLGWLAVPVVLTSICLAIFFGVHHLCKDQNLVGMVQNCIVKTYIFGSFVLYIPLSRTTMSVFSCVDIHGTEYLSGALDQECYNEDHYKYMLVGLVCVLLYPLGIPASWLFLLRSADIPEIVAEKRKRVIFYNIMLHYVAKEIGHLPSNPEYAHSFEEEDIYFVWKQILVDKHASYITNNTSMAQAVKRVKTQRASLRRSMSQASEALPLSRLGTGVAAYLAEDDDLPPFLPAVKSRVTTQSVSGGSSQEAPGAEQDFNPDAARSSLEASWRDAFAVSPSLTEETSTPSASQHSNSPHASQRSGNVTFASRKQFMTRRLDVFGNRTPQENTISEPGAADSQEVTFCPMGGADASNAGVAGGSSLRGILRSGLMSVNSSSVDRHQSPVNPQGPMASADADAALAHAKRALSRRGEGDDDEDVPGPPPPPPRLARRSEDLSRNLSKPFVPLRSGGAHQSSLGVVSPVQRFASSSQFSAGDPGKMSRLSSDVSVYWNQHAGTGEPEADEGRSMLSYLVRSRMAVEGVQMVGQEGDVIDLDARGPSKTRDEMIDELVAYAVRRGTLVKNLQLQWSLNAGVEREHLSPFQQREKRALLFSSMLFAVYQPSFWWWEIVEAGRKFMLCSVMMFIQPGSCTQIIWACLINLAMLLAYLAFKPLSLQLTHNFKIGIAGTTFMDFFIGMGRNAGVMNEYGWSVVLIVMNVFLLSANLIVAACLVGLSAIPMFNESNAKQQLGKDQGGRTSDKTDDKEEDISFHDLSQRYAPDHEEEM